MEFSVLLMMVTCATIETDDNASPRKPNVDKLSKSSNEVNFDVVNRSQTNFKSSF